MMPCSAESLQHTLALAEDTLTFLLLHDCPVDQNNFNFQLRHLFDLT